ncbi:MAG: hypothetical protein WA993_01080 [Candidatus Binatus sp.]|jgi:hypothetical protein|uniref:hypothetical protein n=1 Tax=Candidatus Binatus sp. TaxID=2811406 RepID=UPI003C84FADC
MESTQKLQQMLDELKDSGRLLEIANTAAEINSAVALLEAVNVDTASESLKITLDVLGKELEEGHHGISRSKAAHIQELRSLVEALGPLDVFREQISLLYELHGIKPREAETRWAKLKADNLLARIQTFVKITETLDSINALRHAIEARVEGYKSE